MIAETRSWQEIFVHRIRGHGVAIALCGGADHSRVVDRIRKENEVAGDCLPSRSQNWSRVRGGLDICLSRSHVLFCDRVGGFLEAEFLFYAIDVALDRHREG